MKEFRGQIPTRTNISLHLKQVSFVDAVAIKANENQYFKKKKQNGHLRAKKYFMDIF